MLVAVGNIPKEASLQVLCFFLKFAVDNSTAQTSMSAHAACHRDPWKAGRVGQMLPATSPQVVIHKRRKRRRYRKLDTTLPKLHFPCSLMPVSRQLHMATLRQSREENTSVRTRETFPALAPAWRPLVPWTEVVFLVRS